VAPPPPAVDSATAAPPDAGEPAFAPKPALLAPPRSATWQLEGRTLAAPRDRVLDRAIVADFDADGVSDAVAWTLRAEEHARSAAGELWFYPAAGAPSRITELPGFVPAGPGCTITTELSQNGPHSVVIDARGECGAKLIARTPVRSLMVVSPGAAHPLLASLRIADPAPGETMRFDVSAVDRDADGRDDVSLTITLQSVGTERAATATLGWFQRDGAALREAGEPSRSLGRRASTEAVRAKSKKSAKSAAEGASNLRRLAGAICAEGGVPRIIDADGSALKCAGLTSVVDRTAEAEVQAALTRGDALEASAALSRSDWYFGGPSQAQRTALAKLLDRAVTRRDIVEIGPVATRVRGHDLAAPPRYSPITFEAAGTLLAQSDAGLVRITPEPLVETPLAADAAPAPWPLEVRGADGKRWTGVAHACDRSELLLTFAPPESAATPLVAARPGPCGGRAAVRVSTAPLGWAAGGVVALIDGAVVASGATRDVALPDAAPGTPRSPDGKFLVASGARGLLITGGERPELWRWPEPPPGTVMSECVIGPGGVHAACVDQGRVRLFKAGGR
jgi:hypothetical protein